MAVRQVRVVQRLLGSRAKYHAMAVVALQLLVVLAQLFGREIAQVGTQHREIEGHPSLQASLYTLQQLLIGREQADAQAAILQLVLQGLACQVMPVDDRRAPPQQRLRRLRLAVVVSLG
ncbi:hypothetical protein D3C79_797750 [compost metagenome]